MSILKIMLRYYLLLSLIFGILLSYTTLGSIPVAYAADFFISTSCENRVLHILITDSEGNPLQNVDVRTLKSLTTRSGFETKFLSDNNGIVMIPPQLNTGFVWVTKGGYNDQKNSVKICPVNEVPDWIKNNAKWWTEGNIDEKTFLEGIKFLVKNKVLNVPQSSQNFDCIIYQEKNSQSTDTSPYISGCLYYDNTNRSVPEWIKNNVEWWADGFIDDDTFVMGIQHLITERVIELNDSKSIFEKDARFPSLETLKKLVIDEEWDVSSSSSTICSSFVGLESQRGMTASKHKINPRGDIEYHSFLGIDICEFDSLENSNRGFTGSTSLDDEIFATSSFSGYSDDTGRCFLDLPREVGYPFFDNASWAGCTKNNEVISIVYITDDRQGDEKSLDMLSELMDEIIKKSNNDSVNNVEYQFEKVVGYAFPETPQVNIRNQVPSTDENFAISVVKCEDPNGFGDYIEVQFGISSNMSVDYTLDLQVILLDEKNNVLGIERTYADAKPGRMIFDTSLIPYERGTASCLVEIVDGYPS